jgi:hypothetical protein
MNYIRVGELPEDGKSKIHFRGEVVGEEIGVSVWHTMLVDSKYCIVIPNPCNEDTVDDVHGNLLQVICFDRPVYLVTGEEIGKGSDGEPVLQNVKIIEDITSHFAYLKKREEEPLISTTEEEQE